MGTGHKLYLPTLHSCVDQLLYSRVCCTLNILSDCHLLAKAQLMCKFRIPLLFLCPSCISATVHFSTYIWMLGPICSFSTTHINHATVQFLCPTCTLYTSNIPRLLQNLNALYHFCMLTLKSPGSPSMYNKKFFSVHWRGAIGKQKPTTVSL